jgi:hypothetical protein
MFSDSYTLDKFSALRARTGWYRWCWHNCVRLYCRCSGKEISLVGFFSITRCAFQVAPLKKRPMLIGVVGASFGLSSVIGEFSFRHPDYSMTEVSLLRN